MATSELDDFVEGQLASNPGYVHFLLTFVDHLQIIGILQGHPS